MLLQHENSETMLEGIDTDEQLQALWKNTCDPLLDKAYANGLKAVKDKDSHLLKYVLN